MTTLAQAILAVARAAPADVLATTARVACELSGARAALVHAVAGLGPGEQAAFGLELPAGASAEALVAEAPDVVVERVRTADEGERGFVAVVAPTRAEPDALAALAEYALLRKGERLLAKDAASTRTLYRTLVEQIPAVTYYRPVDKPGTPSFVSPQMEALIGFTPDELVADPDLWRKRVHPDDLLPIISGQRFYDPYKQKEPLHVEYRLLHKDGRVVWVENFALAVRDNEDKPLFVVGLLFDITERKQLEEQLRHAQKMEAIGKLAGGIAHDFNNLLSIVLSYGASLVDEHAPGDPRRAEAKEIVRAGERARQMVQQLLALSQRQMLSLKVVDLREAAIQMQALFRRVLGEDIELVLELGPTTRPVKADPGQLEHVVMNLALNAREAMPRGGRMTLALTDVELDAAFVRAHAGVAPGAFVRLALSDTGAGMDEATRARAFEPFFTTKDPQRHSGLGLSTALGVVVQSGGIMRVTSAPGQGSSFEVYLPVATEDRPVGPAPTMSNLKRGTETVLLAEDDEQVRHLVRALLERLGYTVLESARGDAALELAARHAGRIDLLLTDVVMPHMSGFELAQELEKIRPDTQVIFMSGYSEDAVTRHGVPRDTNILQKPFSFSELANRLRATLDAPHAPRV